MPLATAMAAATAAVTPASTRSRAPDSTVMVAVTTTRTMATPRAGSMMTSAISGAATARASSTDRRPSTAPQRGWLNTVAMARISTTLANSDGSTWKPPGRSIQARAPLTSWPSGVRTAPRPSRVTR